MWAHDEILLNPTDPYQAAPPHALQEIFSTILQAHEEAVRSVAKPNMNRKEQVELEMRVRSELKDTCTAILDDKDNRETIESLWASQIRPNENPAEFKFNTYQEWVEDFEKHRIPNSVVVAEDWNMDVPIIAQKTKHTAFFNTSQDIHGTIRSKRLSRAMEKPIFRH